MPLIHHTDNHAAIILANRTRRIDIDTRSLSDAHRDVGRFLSYSFINQLELESYPIQHCQGTRNGFRIKDESQIALVCLMRSGQYIADGLRDILRDAPLFPVTPQREIGLNEADLQSILANKPRVIVLIDAVINTGNSLRPILNQISKLTDTSLHVLTSVGPDTTALSLSTEFPLVTFEYLRLSKNQYTGYGRTDTGDRLFGRI